MAILCVQNADKVNLKSVLDDAMSYKSGMVIDIVPDGWQFRPDDLKLPMTQVSVPGVSVDQLSAFVTPKAADTQLNTVAQKRAFKFDLLTWQLQGGKPLSFPQADALRLPVVAVTNNTVLGDANGAL